MGPRSSVAPQGEAYCGQKRKEKSMKTTSTVWALAIASVVAYSHIVDAASPEEYLITATKDGNVATVEKLLQQGVNVNTADERGITPLHWSCNNLPIAEALLKKGANADAKTKDGISPIHWAVAKQQKGVVKALIAHKASINARDKNGDTPLHWAVDRGYNDLAELLVLSGADVNAQNDEKGTPLQAAAYKGNEPMVTFLRSRGGKSPAYDLLDAVVQGDVPKAKSLLASGVKTDVPAGVYRSTVLHWAALKSRQALLEAFVQSGADVNVKDDAEATPLHYAARGGSRGIVQYLISKGADIKSLAVQPGTDIFYRDSTFTVHTPQIETTEGTALHWAAYAGREDVADLLISKGADINARSRGAKGLTPICFAAMEGHEKLVQVFVQKGASVEVSDEEFGSPLHYAKTRSIAEALIRAGSLVTAKCEWYGSALHLAAYEGRKEVIELLLEKRLVVDDTAKWRIHGPLSAPYQATPLYVAVLGGKFDVVKLLVARGADVNFKTTDGAGTVLHAAAWAGSRGVCGFLIEKGAKVDQRADFDVVGRGSPFTTTWPAVTPMLIAADRGNLEVLTLLLDQGADVNAKDKNGYTAVDWAANDQVKEILQKRGAKLGKP